MSKVPNGLVGDWRLADEAFLETYRPPSEADKTELLAARHPYPRDARITFRESDHKYFVRNVLPEDRDAEEVVCARGSITGLVARYHPPFDADAALRSMRSGRNWRRKRVEYLDADGADLSDGAIKRRWQTNGRVQSARGTLMHYHIEQHLNGCVVEEPRSPEFKQYLDFEREVLTARRLTPLRTEVSLFHVGLRMAGQCDLLCRDAAGRVVVVDWKRSKDIKMENRFARMRPPLEHLDDCNWWHYALQLNIYRYILASEYGEIVAGMLLGVFHPCQNQAACIDVPVLDREVAEVVEALKAAGLAGDPVAGPDAYFPGEPAVAPCALLRAHPPPPA